MVSALMKKLDMEAYQSAATIEMAVTDDERLQRGEIPSGRRGEKSASVENKVFEIRKMERRILCSRRRYMKSKRGDF